MPTLAELDVVIRANLKPFNDTMKQAETQILDFQKKLNAAGSGSGSAFSINGLSETAKSLKQFSEDLKEVSKDLSLLSKTDVKFFNRVAGNIDHASSRLNNFSKNIILAKDKILAFKDQKFVNGKTVDGIVSIKKEAIALTTSLTNLETKLRNVNSSKFSKFAELEKGCESAIKVVDKLITSINNFHEKFLVAKAIDVDFTEVASAFLDLHQAVNGTTKELGDFSKQIHNLVTVNGKLRSFVQNFDKIAETSKKLVETLPTVANGLGEIEKAVPENFDAFRTDVQNLATEVGRLSGIINTTKTKLDKFGEITKLRKDLAEAFELTRKFSEALNNLAESIQKFPKTDHIDFTSFGVQIIDLANEAARLKLILNGINKEIGTLSRSNPKDFKQLGTDFRKSVKPAEDLLDTLGKIKIAFDTFDQNVNFNFAKPIAELNALKEPLNEVAKIARNLKTSLAAIGKVKVSDSLEKTFNKLATNATTIKPVLELLSTELEKLSKIDFQNLTKLSLQLNTIGTGIKKISENLNKVQGEQRFNRLASNLERLKIAATGLAQPLHEVAQALNSIHSPNIGEFGTIFHQLRRDILALRTDIARLHSSRISSSRTGAGSIGALAGAEFSAASRSNRFLHTGGPGMMTGTLAGVAGGFSVYQLQQYADQYTNLQNRLATTASLTGTYVASLEDLRKAANESNSALETTVNLYARLAFSGSKYLKSEEEVMMLTKTLQKGLLLSGATASETNSAITQFTQSLAAGRLNGDELRSLVENAPILINAIAKEFGVNPGDLKDMGARGELDIKRVLKAILSVTGDIETAFNMMDKSIEATFQTLKNNFIMWLGRSDDVVKATEKINAVILGVADNIDAIAYGAAAAAAALLLMASPAILGAILNPWIGLPVLIGTATGLLYKFGDEINILESQTGSLGDAFDVVWDDMKTGFSNTIDTLSPLFKELVSAINGDLEEIDVDTVLNESYRSFQRFIVNTKTEFLLFVAIISETINLFETSVNKIIRLGGLIPEEFGRNFKRLVSPLTTLMDVTTALVNKGVENGTISQDSEIAKILKQREKELNDINNGKSFSDRVASKNVENALIEGGLKIENVDRISAAFDLFNNANLTMKDNVDNLMEISKNGLSIDKTAGYGSALGNTPQQYLLKYKAPDISDTSILNLPDNVAKAIMEAYQKMERSGIVPPLINSGVRSYEDQKRLYDNRGNNPYPVARPGTSAHEKGNAIDFGITKYSKEEQDMIRTALKSSGFIDNVKGDPVHFTYYGELGKSAKSANTGKQEPQFANDFERGLFDSSESVKAMEAQLKVLQDLNPLVEDYGYQMAYAQEKQRLLTLVEKENLELTPERIKAIDEYAQKTAIASAELEKLRNQQQLAQARIDDFRNTTKDVFGGFISDMKNGVSATEALANALDKISDKLLDMSLNYLFDTKEKGGSGIFDSFFKSGGDAIGSFFSNLFGADSGGYTGNVPTDQVTGWHHGQEYVLKANATRAIGVNTLDKINATGQLPTIAVPNYNISKASNSTVHVVLEAQTDPSVIMQISDSQIRKAAPGIVTTSVVQSQKTTRKNMASMMINAQNKEM